MTETFEPHNTLEQKLLDAQEGRMLGEQFLLELLDEQLYMPIKEHQQVEGLQTSSNADPLRMEDEEGNIILILFTSPDRSKNFTADLPDYRGGLLVELPWILERIGSGVGMAINPGWPAGIDLDPETVAQLIQISAAKSNAE
ncbi:hypothetical protein BOW53_05725 [Solemya pervernicosa gill symbiont]|uniref:SseB protein N-terminal domain-containing protein n=2 Tax=Gammaproteobacteria incertae sedis TaxID=118884 RepID=A0A1T2L7G3_9GAMM|nr:SseB family protein [Candidatus Reidiella endopervernicosa]OOZ41049.1 hypothetical protein BOW53_05725 [Solemya pervernicosa gill symbiont]QKQ25080.1 SseB family protein [Candidatus Reidiella endopervernicosa]